MDLRNIPEGITEEQVKEWVAVLVERFENAKVNQIPEVTVAVKNAQENIDGFRTANALSSKFKPAEDVKVE